MAKVIVIEDGELNIIDQKVVCVIAATDEGEETSFNVYVQGEANSQEIFTMIYQFMRALNVDIDELVEYDIAYKIHEQSQKSEEE